ncbi:MAG TPA: uracil-DNA glycosylase [Acidimicrobiales bacterium]|nr:uracil-DNA glycosylase [Acidimicrobiales bacterium]
MRPPSAPAPPEPDGGRSALAALTAEIVSCRRCPRLVEWRERVARERRASFADQEYWGRPVPGFGDPRARIAVVGLAPAAHGGNRTGRVFTGDRSGDWLFAAMWRAGLANQPTSVAADDGLELSGAYVCAAVRCAPPQNKPTPTERTTCAPYLRRELDLLSDVRVVLVLGQFAYQVVAAELGLRPRPRFGHCVEAVLPDGRTVLCSYHPSQQNTFTGTLTAPMFDAVFTRALELTANASVGKGSVGKGSVGKGSAPKPSVHTPSVRKGSVRRG